MRALRTKAFIYINNNESNTQDFGFFFEKKKYLKGDLLKI